MSFRFFTEWLIAHPDSSHVLDLFDLIEVSGEFPKGQFNSLFRQQFARRVAQIGTDEAQAQLSQLANFDWIGYIARSLRNAGFKDHDIDPNAHDVVVKLLVSGQLFPRWDGTSPVIARFKVAVRNAIVNQAQKRQTRRRRIPATSIHQDDAELHIRQQRDLLGPVARIGAEYRQFAATLERAERLQTAAAAYFSQQTLELFTPAIARKDEELRQIAARKEMLAEEIHAVQERARSHNKMPC